MRILVVDDERSLRITLAANLELEGFEVDMAEDAQAALERVRARAFDLVLTDIRMPGMNGVELFHEIRQLRPGLPVVLMTGFALEGLVDQALANGAFAVLPKPFTIEQVVATLASAAQRPVVLVVDGAGAEPTAEALCALGVAAEAAVDEPSALRAIREHRVDVCVLDLDEAGRKASLDLAARLLSCEPSLVLIALTGGAAADMIRRAVALGARACLARPVQPADLARAIARARGAPRADRRLHPGGPGAAS